MARKVQTRGGGIEVEGLAETITALRRFDKEVGREAVDIFRDEAKAVQSRAKAISRVHLSAPSKDSWIGRSATGKGAGVKLIAAKGGYRAHATEWGMHKFQHPTWGGTIRRTVQRAMRRRTFRPWKGSNFSVSNSGPGYVIQRAIREMLPGMEERVADRLQRLLRRTLDRAGVPRG